MHWEGWLASLSSLVCGGALYLMQRALNKRDGSRRSGRKNRNAAGRNDWLRSAGRCFYS